MAELNREDVIRRWKAARQRKKEVTDRMVAELVEDYEKKYGVKPKYIEVW